MELLYIYPFAQAPDYKKPTTPIRAFLINDELTDVVDVEEVPYGPDNALEKCIKNICKRNKFKPKKNCDKMCKTVGEGIHAIKTARSIEEYLTPERTAELLALFSENSDATPKKETKIDRKKGQKLHDKIMAERDAEIAELNMVFNQIIKDKFNITL